MKDVVRLKRQGGLKLARAVVYSSADGVEWYITPPEHVPAWAKTQEAMGYMLAGQVLSLEESGPFFCAETIH